MSIALSRYIIAALCCLSITMSVWAQKDAVEELKQISERYMSYTNFQTEFTYRFFTDVKKSKLIEKQQGMFVRSGEKMYMNALNTETLHTEDGNVTVNHEQKIMMVSRSNPKIKEPDQLMLIGGIDSLLQKNGRMKWRSLNKHLCQITVLYNEGQIKAAAIFYNPQTYLISEVQLVFANTEGLNWEWESHEPLLSIKYRDTHCNEEVNENYFNEKKFIQKQDGKITPVLSYKNYQFFSN